MKRFVLGNLDDWHALGCGDDLVLETMGGKRSVSVEFNVTETVEVWLCSMDGARPDRLLACSDGLFNIECTLSEGLCVRVAGDNSARVFWRTRSGSQALAPSEQGSFTKPLPPAGRIHPEVERMMQRVRKSELLRQQQFEAMSQALSAALAAKSAPTAVQTAPTGAKTPQDAAPPVDGGEAPA